MVPDMSLIRKHLMIEGHIGKECLVRILQEVTDVYRKFTFLGLVPKAEQSCSRKNLPTETLLKANSLSFPFLVAAFVMCLCGHAGWRLTLRVRAFRQRVELAPHLGASHYHWRHPRPILRYDPHV